MTELLDRAMARVRRLPPDAQDEVARLVLAFTDDDASVIELTPEEEASFAESLAQAARRQFASEEQVEAIWAKYGL